MLVIAGCENQPTSSDNTPVTTKKAVDPNDFVTRQAETEEAIMTDIVTVAMQTNKGTITLELDRTNAPLTVNNFISYVEAGHYNGTIFHRVIPGFMIQGGGFTSDMQQKPTRAPIQNEANNGLKNKNYSIAMARTGDPHSATAQFFINVIDNARLDFSGESGQGWGYAVFGRVVEGLEVVNDIETVATQQVGIHGDVPVEAIIIEKITMLQP